MIKVLISLENKHLTDVVRTAFKQFSGFSAYPVPPASLIGLLKGGDYQSVICDLHTGGASENELVAEIRRAAPDVAILALVDRQQKEKFNKLKMDLDIFSCLALPLDPYELGRRILRLEAHVTRKGPVRT